MDWAAAPRDGFAQDDAHSALAVLRALDAPFAVIEFTKDGEILGANENFLAAMGYRTEAEIVGQHHRQFLFPEDAESNDYSFFWKRLAGGDFLSSEVRRRTNSGAEIWLSANYVPIRSSNGTIDRVRKYAIDVTERHDAVDALLYAIRRLADGNILVRLDERVRGDFQYVRDEFNALMDGLEDRMRKTMACTDAIKTVFDDMSATSIDLKDKAENQALEVERTVASIGEISKRTVDNSRAAEVAGSLTRDTVAKAEHGAQIVRDTVEATKRITEITSEVAKITKVIENFAFQTNLLSINAAVEAARAGDAGRGFAVVAGEVRSLAQRSAEASKNIASLTRQSEEEVARGAGLARSAGAALEEIGAGVSQLNDSVGMISEASQQQAASVTEIESAMKTFESTVKDVSHLAQNGRASANSLSRELASLEEQTSHFSTRTVPPEAPPPNGSERRNRG